MIDLRSDTVTRPSREMRQVLAQAAVGDDVYGEDPAVNAFQTNMAALFGKECGLFVPSGVMGNQLALKALTSPGDEVIVEAESHIFHYEGAAPAVISSVQLRPVPGEHGFDTEVLEDAVRPMAYYYPPTRLVCMENTHNRYGGTVLPLETMQRTAEWCREHGIRVHLDGARIWNAHVETGIPLSEYARCCDTINVCFSKGLGAPIGSMLLGPGDLIDLAHRWRKLLGGGMRQAGLLAAAAEHAVKAHLELLRDDHRRARSFASAIAGAGDWKVDPSAVATNMVLIDVRGSSWTPDALASELEQHGVLIGMGRGRSLRAVFHLDIDDQALAQAIDTFRTLGSQI